jgi:hypothetical protein
MQNPRATNAGSVNTGVGSSGDVSRPCVYQTGPAIQRQKFDYAALDRDLADEARGLADRIRDRIRTFTHDTGRDLIAIKEKMPHGAFGAWIAAEFQMSDRTAQNYMGAARWLEGKSAKFAFLPPSAVYALAAPSAPTEVVAEVEAEVESGTVPTVAEIRERLDGFTRAQRAQALVKDAAQAKQERENEKRRRAAVAERERKFEADRKAAEARRDAAARTVAQLLVDRLSANGTIELLTLMQATDWYRVDRNFARVDGGMRRVSSVKEIEAAFGKVAT